MKTIPKLSSNTHIICLDEASPCFSAMAMNSFLAEAEGLVLSATTLWPLFRASLAAWKPENQLFLYRSPESWGYAETNEQGLFHYVEFYYKPLAITLMLAKYSFREIILWNMGEQILYALTNIQPCKWENNV